MAKRGRRTAASRNGFLSCRRVPEAPTISSQCWDKRWLLGRVTPAAQRTSGDFHAPTHHGALRGHRDGYPCPPLGRGGGGQTADPVEPDGCGRNLEPDRQ